MDTNESNGRHISRKERERLLRRSEIISAAREVFALRGFAEATLDEIAERAEFGKGTLYNYFENKEELFEAVIVNSYEAITESAAEVLARETTLYAKFMAVADTLLTQLLRDAGVFMLIMREFNKPVAHSKIVEHYPKLVALLNVPLQEAVTAGEVKECNTEEVAAVFISSIFSVFKYRLFRNFLCNNGADADIIPRYSEAEIRDELSRILEVLRITFFEGILKHDTLSATGE